MTPTSEALTRPRVEGDREREILQATLAVLADVGYDLLTMDAVAKQAHASKATLYRRWTTKVSLVVDALHSVKGAPESLPDTGTLKGDLTALFCGMDGFMEPMEVAIFAAMVTAICRDADFAEAFRREVLGPKIAMSRQVWDRAKERGEVHPDLDLDLMEPCLAGIVMQRVFVLGEQPSADLITRVIDQIILPAATHGPQHDPQHERGTTPTMEGRP